MKEARSAMQAGNSFGPSLFQARVAHAVSFSSSRVSPILGKTKHAVFSRGRLHTVPAQPESCQGTRMDTCIRGSCRAPGVRPDSLLFRAADTMIRFAAIESA